MDRDALEAAGRNYPYQYQHGLYGLPFGALLFLTGLSNLGLEGNGAIAAYATLLLVAATLFEAVRRYYRRTLGDVVLTRRAQRKYVVAAVAGFAVYIGTDQLGRALLGRPPEPPINLTLTTWALGTLTFHALSLGIRLHHLVIWGAAVVAGLLPIWGHGDDRDAIAFFPLAAATILSGLIDHVRLVRLYRSYPVVGVEDSHAAA
jgi:hypothetical protein